MRVCNNRQQIQFQKIATPNDLNIFGR